MIKIENPHSFYEKSCRDLFSFKEALLAYLDSNQERQNQNLQCYHYTISQCVALLRFALQR